MKILMTGFDPFGNEPVNPAWEAVKLVKAPEGMDLVKLEIPTVFGVSGDLVEEAILKDLPDAVLCIGQAGGRSAVTVERAAINIMDAGIPDNRGFQPADLPVVEGGENAYFATVPVKEIIASVNAAHIPCQISNSAGTFVCNALLYRVLHFLKVGNLPVKAGFIHVPFLPGQAEKHPGSPSLPLSSMVTALEAALNALQNP